MKKFAMFLLVLIVLAMGRAMLPPSPPEEEKSKDMIVTEANGCEFNLTTGLEVDPNCKLQPYLEALGR